MAVMREEIFTIKRGRVISRTEGWNFNFIVAIIREERQEGTCGILFAQYRSLPRRLYILAIGINGSSSLDG